MTALLWPVPGAGRLMARDLPNPLSALAEIRRWTFAPAPMQATLRQAMDIMHTNTAEAACIYERSPNTGKQMLHGILTRENIEKFSLASML